MKCALISLDQLWGNKDGNLKKCRKLIESAVSFGAELIMFPEMTLTGFYLDPKKVGEVASDSNTLREFGSLSGEFNTTIVFGACLFAGSDGNARNYLCIAKPDGKTDVVYAKMHTFSHSGEDQVISNGNMPNIVSFDSQYFGASICYDLRFPALYAAYSDRCVGSFVIANWPQSRSKHWFSLLVARAIENQMYMIAVNRTGIDGNGISYEKSSCVVNPLGELEQPLIESGELAIYEILYETVHKYRRDFPTLKDRRNIGLEIDF